MKCHPAEEAADFVARGWWSGDTIDGLLRARVAESGGQPAVADPPNLAALTGHSPRRWSWHDLDAQVDSLAAHLLSSGVRAGDIVAVQLPNCAQLVRSLLAIVRIGAIATPFPTAFREHELVPMCRQTRAVAFLTAERSGDRSLLEQATRVRDEVSSVATVIDVFAELPSESVPVRVADVNDCVTICWTSGTEAAPKAVPRCHGDWLIMAEGCRWSAQLGPRDVLLSPFPMTNMGGIAGMFLPWLMVGGLFLPHHPFDLPTFLRQVTEERATYTVAPPALLTMLLRREDILSTVDIGSLRLIGSGSAPLTPWLVRTWSERHGIDVVNFFGSNEGIALMSDPSDVPDPDHRASYFPHYGSETQWRSPIASRVSVRLVDARTDAVITTAGRAGELRLAGPTVFGGYFTAPDAPLDRSAFDDDGYFRTGDVFEIAGERFLRYVDRARDLIIRGGVNISPAEIEGLLAAHPAVAEVSVIGVPDDVLGERVCAVVVAKSGPPTLAELVDFLREKRVASYKLPERLQLVQALPRNPVGKVLKRELRERVGALVSQG
ncbi:class I adenylate-forming enzyme family protein [Fodinicola acaciae]|uniref:class I adenylate-forming enzyme family protein n=1 Tax=Fodinicola acaciae TaxID=2681555 RepID=UPI0013D0987A|nr:class I adenylate-forming enzyme family protein [Fodinicola acaciae]